MRHFINLRILDKPNSESESINMRVWAAAQVDDCPCQLTLRNCA